MLLGLKNPMFKSLTYFKIQNYPAFLKKAHSQSKGETSGVSVLCA